ncbi:MAG: vWA domain-containing protein [Anaerolineae bacterium]
MAGANTAERLEPSADDPTQQVGVGEPFQIRRLPAPSDRMSRRTSGRRSYTISKRKRGRYVRARDAQGQYDDIAIDATVRQAAPHQLERDHAGTTLAIRDEDLQRKVRVHKTGNLVVFAVDASWSMAAAERMLATKGAIMSLLVDAYQKRDMVAMVSFQKDRAYLVLPPTSSVERANSALQEIPVGGKTPLAAGLLLSYQVIERELNQNPEIAPLLILLTDGAGNVSLTGAPPRDEALMIADMFHDKQFRSVVINTEHESLDRGLARELADRLAGPCYSLADIRADNLYETVRQELDR